MPSLPNEPVNEGEGRKSRRQTKVCDKCGSRFSGEARFCPFDAEPLVVAVESRRPRDPLIGIVIDGRYEMQSVLGEGGMGTVYRVSHRVLGRALALKVLRADLAREEELGLRFLREARAAASISHPNVVQITDFGTLPSGQAYFVMELLSGDSLSRVLRNVGPLPPARVVKLARQMVDALSAAHTAGVIHRDLKPDNILVCPTPGGGEALKVLDFGLAKVAGNSRLTKAGVVFGTPHYMSPEQASGRVVDERTDVYAVGVLMYEMFTGKVPFEADTYMGVLTKHLYVAPTPPSVMLGTALGTALSLGALEQVTLRCLEKKPERRFASMRALGEAIDKVARFDDKGALVISPAVLGDPADDPDDSDAGLPSSLERRILRERPDAERRQGALMVFTLALLGLFAMAVVGLLSRSTAVSAPVAAGAPRPVTAGSASGPPVPLERAALAPRAPALPRASESAAPAAARPPQPAALPSAALPTPVAKGPHPLRTSKGDPAPRAESRPAAAPVTDATKSSTKQKKLVTGEIVDPWGD